jgi:hypothetical protein
MPAFLAGLAALLILVVGAYLLARLDPQKLAAVLRKLAGVVLLALALFLTARGAMPIAIPLAIFGLRLHGVPIGSWFGMGGGGFGKSHKSPGQTSQVRTDALEMELDHDSGRMDGRCLKGSFAGRTLSSLSKSELMRLLAELRASDAESAILLEAYLDHFWPNWRDREADEADRAADRRARGGNRMSREEALEVLGLEPGASEEEIRAAHRKLMKKVHPDQGGSDYLAARINEAKDVLLGRK